MLADLDLALKRPTELIQRLYAEHGSLEGLEQIVADRFSTLLRDEAALGEVMSLGAATKAISLPPAGTLVKFRGMVQDTGLGGELYPGSSADGTKLCMYGMEEGASDISPDNYSKLRERQLFYVISVPGETQWAKEKLDKRGSSGSLSLESLKIAGESGETSAVLSNKNPTPTEASFGLVAKVYGDVDASLKTTDVREFIGILGSASWSTGLEDLTTAETSESALTIPALHVLFSSPAPQPALDPIPESTEAKQAVRDELVEYLAGCFGGDRDAAEWLLLALIARIHTRHATGMALGSLSLNLALPDGFGSDITSPVASLVPAATTLAFTIDTLNDARTRLAPRSRDETLDAGQLQLTSGTAVVVDLRKLGEGKLQDTGVRNLRHLATAITQQKLAYEFPYSAFELDTDLSFVLLSEGKAILPTDCVVYVRPEASGTTTPKVDEEKLDQFRSYISTMKHAPFSIPADMSEVIQSDFVDRRQASQGGEAMTQDDLLFRMTAARLLALSYGETALSKEAWRRTAELDDRRKERMPTPPAEAAVSA